MGRHVQSSRGFVLGHGSPVARRTRHRTAEVRNTSWESRAVRNPHGRELGVRSTPSATCTLQTSVQAKVGLLFMRGWRNYPMVTGRPADWNLSLQAPGAFAFGPHIRCCLRSRSSVVRRNACSGLHRDHAGSGRTPGRCGAPWRVGRWPAPVAGKVPRRRP